MPTVGDQRSHSVVRIKFTFSLRTLLACVAVFAILMAFIGTHVVRYYDEQSRIASISLMGAQVFTEPRGHFFLRQFMGDFLFQRAVYIHVDNPGVADNWLEDLQGLRYVELVSIKSEGITDVGLQHLRHLPNLRRVNLVNTKTTKEGVESLRASLSKSSLVTCYDIVNGEFVNR